jgi:hypothetical protein
MKPPLITTLLYAFFSLGASIWVFLYYKGRLNYVGEKEENRKRRVNKYGLILIVCGIIFVICGVMLLLGALIEIFGI